MRMKLYDVSDWCKQGTEVKNYPYIGEIDISSLPRGMVIKVKDNYYVPFIINLDDKIIGVIKTEINFNPDVNNGKNLTCPYCGHEELNSLGLPMSGEYECKRCGGIMSYQRRIVLEYSSSPAKPPNVLYLQ